MLPDAYVIQPKTVYTQFYSAATTRSRTLKSRPIPLAPALGWGRRAHCRRPCVFGDIFQPHAVWAQGTGEGDQEWVVQGVVRAAGGRGGNITPVPRSTRRAPAYCGSLQRRYCHWSWREGGGNRNRFAGLAFDDDYAIECSPRSTSGNRKTMLDKQAGCRPFRVPTASSDNTFQTPLIAVLCPRPTDFNRHNPQFGSNSLVALCGLCTSLDGSVK